MSSIPTKWLVVSFLVTLLALLIQPSPEIIFALKTWLGITLGWPLLSLWLNSNFLKGARSV